MSVRVNLLPEATKQRGRANQQRGIALVAALVLLAVLGGVWWWADSQVRQAEAQLADAQAVTASLRAEEAELIAFRDLATRRDRSEDVLRSTLGEEVSMAGIFQDIAAVMPGDAQLDTLNVNILPASEERPDVVGTFTVTGQSLTSHAPGVETVLLSLDKVSSFGELFLNSSSLAEDREEPIVTFSVDGALSVAARTQRYADGLPEGLR